MKKKIKKYISGCIVASLLLSSIPFQVVLGAGTDSKGAREQEISINENGSAETTLSGMDDGNDVIVEKISESDNDIEAPVADGQETSDTKWESKELADEDGANEISDPEDITEEFIDPAFRSAVRKELRLNENDMITKSACASITYLHIPDQGIKSLQGIKNLIYLSTLYCNGNQLTDLDVTGCTNLNFLDCSSNQLTDLDVSGCIHLTTLECSSNRLTSLDVSDCIHLTTLGCGNNRLKSLDLSDYSDLSRLYCGGNQLTSLNVANCINLSSLSCGDNQLTNLDVTDCSNLKDLSCAQNELIKLDVSNCSGLTNLYCSRNQLIDLDVRSNTNLKRLWVDSCTKLVELRIGGYNNLEALNLTGCIKITELNLNGYTQLKSLDIKNCERLEELNLKDCSNLNRLGSLEVGDCKKLTNVNMENCSNATEVDFKFCYSLKKLNLKGCSKMRKISLLRCSGLKELNLDGCERLEELDADSCDILQELNVSGCTQLRILIFTTNNPSVSLKRLNVNSCINLEKLSCYGHTLEGLDVTDCIGLEELGCSRSGLKKLDVSNCSRLEKLYCAENRLRSLDISNCPKLIRLDCSLNNMRSPDDVKGRIKEFDGESFVFYPQNDDNADIEPTVNPTPTQDPSIKPTDKPDPTPSAGSIKGFKKKYYLRDLLEHYGEMRLNIDIPRAGRLRFVFDQCEDPDYSISCWYKSPFKYIPFMTTNKEETAYTNWCAVLPGTIEVKIESDTSVNAEATLCVVYQPEGTYIGEVEPNDSFDTADKIPLNTTFWGSESSEYDTVDGPDMDYFYFDVDTPSKMKITTKDFDYSYNNNAVSLYKESRYGNVEHITDCLYYKKYFFPVMRLSPGRYFLVISTRNTEDYDYSIYISLKKESDRSYEQEDNDLSSRANKKETNKWYIGNINIYRDEGGGGYSYDRDWYQFKIPKKSYIEMGLRTPRQAEDSVIANLYAPSKKVIASIVSTENPYSKTKKILVNPGTYYIRINCNDSGLGFTKVNWDYRICLSQKNISKKVQSPRVDRRSLRLYAGGKTTNLKVSKAKGKITYKSQDPKVAKVTDKGKVIPKKAGKTIIIIKIAGNSIYKPATIKVSVTVKNRS